MTSNNNAIEEMAKIFQSQTSTSSVERITERKWWKPGIFLSKGGLFPHEKPSRSNDKDKKKWKIPSNCTGRQLKEAQRLYEDRTIKGLMPLVRKSQGTMSLPSEEERSAAFEAWLSNPMGREVLDVGEDRPSDLVLNLIENTKLAMFYAFYRVLPQRMRSAAIAFKQRNEGTRDEMNFDKMVAFLQPDTTQPEGMLAAKEYYTYRRPAGGPFESFLSEKHQFYQELRDCGTGHTIHPDVAKYEVLAQATNEEKLVIESAIKKRRERDEREYSALSDRKQRAQAQTYHEKNDYLRMVDLVVHERIKLGESYRRYNGSTIKWTDARMMLFSASNLALLKEQEVKVLFKHLAYLIPPEGNDDLRDEYPERNFQNLVKKLEKIGSRRKQFTPFIKKKERIPRKPPNKSPGIKTEKRLPFHNKERVSSSKTHLGKRKPVSEVQCRYFLYRGGCKKPKCPFKHDASLKKKVEEQNKRRRPNRSGKSEANAHEILKEPEVNQI